VTIFNFGSIVSDNFYRTPRIPTPGESVRAESFKNGLGGKGANQSIAAKRAGSDVFHIGAVGYETHLNQLSWQQLTDWHPYLQDHF
jgi:ribokinase